MKAETGNYRCYNCFIYNSEAYEQIFKESFYCARCRLDNAINNLKENIEEVILCKFNKRRK